LIAPAASVVVATRDRPAALHETLAHLSGQIIEAPYEIVVVDDGSKSRLEPVVGPLRRLIRLDGKGRSAARNAGAEAAQAEVLVFIDDDITVGPGFVEEHLLAQKEWPGVLATGAIRLPDGTALTPFGRFRRQLEQSGLPQGRGLTPLRNFCAAGNVSIPRAVFKRLGGFDREIESGEDQDLALRHTACGGLVAYVPEATGLHRDEALDLARYCRRTEWGSEHILAFCRRYPEWADNRERDRVNGPTRWGGEPFSASAKKTLKRLLATAPGRAALFVLARALERGAPESAALQSLYRGLLGVHTFRGYRRGLERMRSMSVERQA
jgi:GT2 family glycosyltransferase